MYPYVVPEAFNSAGGRDRRSNLAREDWLGYTNYLKTPRLHVPKLGGADLACAHYACIRVVQAVAVLHKHTCKQQQQQRTALMVINRVAETRCRPPHSCVEYEIDPSHLG